MANIVIDEPAFIKITNASDVTKKFVPYRENFVTKLAAGKTVEFKVFNAGQVMYYLKQATEGLEVSQIDALDSASDDIFVINVPAKITLTNTGTTKQIFHPYKENFTYVVEAGDSVELQTKNVSQVLYYLSQATKTLVVTQEAVED